MIDKSLKLLKTQQDSVDDQIEEFLKKEAETNNAVVVIQSVPGVGTVTTSTLISDLPELGTLNRSEIAKLAGVAPIANQSGNRDKKRSIFGGRSHVRRVLYMAALVATRLSFIGTVTDDNEKDDLFGEQGDDYLDYGNGDKRKN